MEAYKPSGQREWSCCATLLTLLLSIRVFKLLVLVFAFLTCDILRALHISLLFILRHCSFGALKRYRYPAASTCTKSRYLKKEGGRRDCSCYEDFVHVEKRQIFLKEDLSQLNVLSRSE